jgi:hypothetical protein
VKIPAGTLYFQDKEGWCCTTPEYADDVKNGKEQVAFMSPFFRIKKQHTLRPAGLATAAVPSGLKLG